MESRSSNWFLLLASVILAALAFVFLAGCGFVIFPPPDMGAQVEIDPNDLNVSEEQDPGLRNRPQLQHKQRECTWENCSGNMRDQVEP